MSINKIKFRIQNIHFIGIGGSGMSGIAEILHNLGYHITGSDIVLNTNIRHLQQLGINITLKHNKNNLKNAQAIVVSSAIKSNNPEIIYAKEQKIPIVPRAQMLAEIMRFSFGIAISGTHGKTTTTSLIAHMLATANLDPTYIIGGILNSSRISNKLGSSNYLIAEADESDSSFLHLQPIISVITNIDRDHLPNYNNNYSKLKQAFVNFSANLPFYGLCVVCIDDDGVKKIINKINRQIITYGLSKQADIQATDIIYQQKNTIFTVLANKKSFKVALNLIGKHNVLNSLAAIAICQELSIKTTIIQQALKSFSGVARRMDFKGTININNKKIIVIDDYAHHPEEIKAVVNSIKNSYPNNNLVAIFQPHRYSRTQDLFDDFALELSKINTLILLPIYPAGEKEIAGIHSITLANSIRNRTNNKIIVAKNFNDCKKVFKSICLNNDILLTIGAGDISQISQQLINEYN